MENDNKINYEKEIILKDQIIKSQNELIKTKDEIIKSKEELIKSKDEIIKSKDELIKLKDDIIKKLSEIKIEHKPKIIEKIPDFNFPLNPRLIKMKYNNKEYCLVSHRYHDKDKINGENSKLAMHNDSISGSKFLFIKDKDNLFSIIFDNDYKGMYNWKIFSDGKNITLNKKFESRFEIIEFKEKKNHFFIKHYDSGKYLYIENKRDGDSYYIGLSDNFNLIDREKYIFYI